MCQIDMNRGFGSQWCDCPRCGMCGKLRTRPFYPTMPWHEGWDSPRTIETDRTLDHIPNPFPKDKIDHTNRGSRFTYEPFHLKNITC